MGLPFWVVPLINVPAPMEMVCACRPGEIMRANANNGTSARNSQKDVRQLLSGAGHSFTPDVLSVFMVFGGW